MAVDLCYPQRVPKRPVNSRIGPLRLLYDVVRDKLIHIQSISLLSSNSFSKIQFLLFRELLEITYFSKHSINNC